jgi:UDP-N-acetylglucosamine 1-carboxyvinyltransferase
MSTRYIEGGHPLEGQIKPSGSKDSAIKLIIASLFSNEDVVLDNIPRTYSVDVLFHVIKGIGGTISWAGDNKLIINASTINTFEIPLDVGSQSHFVQLMAGPLIYRFSKAKLPKP